MEVDVSTSTSSAPVFLSSTGSVDRTHSQNLLYFLKLNHLELKHCHLFKKNMFFFVIFTFHRLLLIKLYFLFWTQIQFQDQTGHSSVLFALRCPANFTSTWWKTQLRLARRMSINWIECRVDANASDVSLRAWLWIHSFITTWDRHQLLPFLLSYTHWPHSGPAQYSSEWYWLSSRYYSAPGQTQLIPRTRSGNIPGWRWIWLSPVHVAQSFQRYYIFNAVLGDGDKNSVDVWLKMMKKWVRTYSSGSVAEQKQFEKNLYVMFPEPMVSHWISYESYPNLDYCEF